MNFLIFAHPVAVNYANTLVSAIANANHTAILVDHMPSVTELLNAQNGGQRILVLGYEDANSDHVTERVGGAVVQRTRSDFLAHLTP